MYHSQHGQSPGGPPTGAPSAADRYPPTPSGAPQPPPQPRQPAYQVNEPPHHMQHPIHQHSLSHHPPQPTQPNPYATHPVSATHHHHPSHPAPMSEDSDDGGGPSQPSSGGQPHMQMRGPSGAQLAGFNYTSPYGGSYPYMEHEGDMEGEEGERGASGEPNKKKRRRQALSCTECKRRKIKCDRSHPCGPCMRRGDQDKCKWHVIEPVEKFVTRAEYDEIKNRLARMEAFVASLAPAQAHQQGFPGPLPSSPSAPQHPPQHQQPSPHPQGPYNMGMMGVMAGPGPMDEDSGAGPQSRYPPGPPLPPLQSQPHNNNAHQHRSPPIDPNLRDRDRDRSRERENNTRSPATPSPQSHPIESSKNFYVQALRDPSVRLHSMSMNQTLGTHHHHQQQQQSEGGRKKELHLAYASPSVEKRVDGVNEMGINTVEEEREREKEKERGEEREGEKRKMIERMKKKNGGSSESLLSEGSSRNSKEEGEERMQSVGKLFLALGDGLQKEKTGALIERGHHHYVSPGRPLGVGVEST